MTVVPEIRLLVPCYDNFCLAVVGTTACVATGAVVPTAAKRTYTRIYCVSM